MDDIIFDSNPDGAPAGLDERVAQLADPEWADNILVDDDVEQNSTPENTETFTESSQRFWRVDHSTGTYKYKVGKPGRIISQFNCPTYEHVTVTFQKWASPYAAKYTGGINFDLTGRTFHIASGVSPKN
ncbi:hypothetical protein MGG_16576 [Pyricularia oryzae 70-15]|uniref:Uncharacterized protein n=1 Tax=Pyricularia oryzae (strain 70-15 / ATCC MYA-4617 / FGSC 8958) TaxID=242507 RepID=G4MLX7_PYRO7|nr:uncharacterized protein MGG_16576 [Pyricularia oryzae 70-15]EHA58544.1 hypothetical protein MGG_16576 [Pyricularia oryzae 70-15]